MFQNTDTRNRPILDELQMIPLMLIQRRNPSIFPPPYHSPARGNPEILALLKSLWHVLELAKMKTIDLLFPMMFKNVFCSSCKYKAARKLSAIYMNKYRRKNLWSGRSWVNTSAWQHWKHKSLRPFPSVLPNKIKKKDVLCFHVLLINFCHCFVF